MTNSTPIPGPQVPAIVLFGRIAPAYAAELSHQLHRAGLVNSNDLLSALATGLRSFARGQGVCLATDFRRAWPEALRSLRQARSEAEWEALLAQTATAPRAKDHAIVLGASRLIKVLEASQQVAGMSPRVATALGAWVITAVVIAHSGPLDADLSLEDFADCL